MIFEYSPKEKISYSVIGNGKTKLLFLHGFGASSYTWNYILRFFNKEKYTLYLIDLLGHGHSSYNYNSDYSINSQVNIVKKFIEFSQITDFILVGHSYGGSIALMLTILHKGYLNINKLILIGVGGFPNKLPFFINYLRNPVTEIFIKIFVPKYLKAYYTLKKLYFNNALINTERIENYSRFYGYDQWNAIVKAAKLIIPVNFV